MPKTRLASSPSERAAQWLLDAHQRRGRFAPLPEELAPRTAAEAYEIQDRFVALRARTLGGRAGYKISLASEAMRRMVGIDEPQAGVLLASTLHSSPAHVRAADYVHLIVEFEVAVELELDLPAVDAPYSRASVTPAVRAVMPAIELADDRHADYGELARHPCELIADNGWSEGAVLGAPLQRWQDTDLAALEGVARINGRVAGEGTGAAAMGHPLDALAWLANHLAARGRGLVRSDVVITGSMITSKPAASGELVQFSLAGLGSAEVRVD